MSRLASLSPAAIAAMFSADADADLIALLTITGAGIVTPIRLANGYTQRLSTTAAEVFYGVVSRSNNFAFLPFRLTIPDEQVASAPRATIAIEDVTGELIPQIRQLTTAPTVLIELVLSSTPNTLEVAFPGFLMGAISYNANQITAELTVKSLASEPFPAHNFTPSYFPGLF